MCGVREARTLDLRITRNCFSYETYALANCATTPLVGLEAKQTPLLKSSRTIANHKEQYNQSSLVLHEQDHYICEGTVGRKTSIAGDSGASSVDVGLRTHPVTSWSSVERNGEGSALPTLLGALSSRWM